MEQATDERLREQPTAESEKNPGHTVQRQAASTMPGLRTPLSHGEHTTMLLFWGWPQAQKTTFSFPCRKQSHLCASTEHPSFPFLVSSSCSVGLLQVSPKPNPGQQHCPEAPVTPCTMLSERSGTNWASFTSDIAHALWVENSVLVTP